MSDQIQLPGELLYEYTLKTTQVVEYGVSLQALTMGQVAAPQEGARFDVHFEGPLSGARLSGSMEGVTHMRIRADGRAELHFHAVITTEDGKNIAMAADGVALGRPPLLQLRINVTLATSHPEYAWVNPIQIWAVGTTDAATGEARAKGYIA
jgi:Protein of unknown function (DUF3237)